MASTKYDIASSALILCGADAVSSFSNTDASSAEEKVCYHLYQSTLDQWLSLYDWRFAMKEEQLSRNATAPVGGKWSASYNAPGGMKKLRNVVYVTSGQGLEYDRFENMIYTNVDAETAIAAHYTFEPSVPYWPGYFVALMEVALGKRFAFALAGKLDLKMDFDDDVEKFFRLAKAADSQSQTSRRLNLRGRGSILEARRA